MRWSSLCVVALLFALWLGPACSSDSTDTGITLACVNGQTTLCACADGSLGNQTCENGTYGTCVCQAGGDTGNDTATSDDTAGVDADDSGSDDDDAPDTGEADNDTDDSNSDDVTDAETPDASDTTDTTPNACGGTAPLLWQGAVAAPSDPCGCGGTLACSDGGNALDCTGERPADPCGGCSTENVELGDVCGTCTTGVWACEDSTLLCQGGTEANECGGCAALAGVPGNVCDGDDGAGLWACDGENAVICLGEGRNACGGLGLLNATPGTPCGQCLGGSWVCAGREAVACRNGDERINVCGGCGTLTADIGDACGCGGAWACDAANPDVLECENANLNACGGCGILEGTPGETCEGGRIYCASADQVLCGTAFVNACGGADTLTQSPGGICGTCGGGTWACASLNSVFCDGDPGPSAANACGGCGTLSAAIGSRCGTCNSGTVICDGLDTTRCAGDRGPEAESLWYADVDRDLWGDPATATRACTAPAGYVARAGDCNDAAVLVNPDALEIPGNGVDDNCDLQELCYRDADGDGFRAIGSQLTVLSPDVLCRNFGAAPATAPATDCDDSNPSAYPAATEVVGNGVDEDCDRRELCYVDGDGDGYRRDTATTALSSDLNCGGNRQLDDLAPTGDCDDTRAQVNPGQDEVCDGFDNDCNGTVDDPLRAAAACFLSNAADSCVSGACAVASCTPGWGDCNEQASDGCELSVLDNPLNCGTCGRRCGGTEACVEGVCIPQRQPVAILSDFPMCIRRFNGVVSCQGYIGVAFDAGIAGEAPALVDIPSLTGAVDYVEGVSYSCVRYGDGRVVCPELQDLPPFVTPSGFLSPPNLNGARSLYLSDSRWGCWVRADGGVECWGDSDGGVVDPTGSGSTRSIIALPLPALVVHGSETVACAQLEDQSLWCWGRVPVPGSNLSPDRAPISVAPAGTVDQIAVTDTVIFWRTPQGALRQRRTGVFSAPCATEIYASGVTALDPDGIAIRLQDGQWYLGPACFATGPYPGLLMEQARTTGVLLEHIRVSSRFGSTTLVGRVCQIFTDLSSACGPYDFDTEDPDLDGFGGQFNGIVTPTSEYPFCSDSIDNDGDGLVNCRDPDCSAAWSCASITGVDVGRRSALITRANGLVQAWGMPGSVGGNAIYQYPFNWGETVSLNFGGRPVRLRALDEVGPGSSIMPDTYCYINSVSQLFECFGAFSTLLGTGFFDERLVADVRAYSDLSVLISTGQLYVRGSGGGFEWFEFPSPSPISSFAPVPSGDSFEPAIGVLTVSGQLLRTNYDASNLASSVNLQPWLPAQGGPSATNPVALCGDGLLACVQDEDGRIECWTQSGAPSVWATGATDMTCLGGTLCYRDASNALRCRGQTGFTGRLDNVTDYDLGATSGCAVVDQREVWCWGSNDSGQLGNGGTGGFSARPARVFGQ
jgi:hypothetical protein